jgi:GNAT superfamily N-acetyltransferase
MFTIRKISDPRKVSESLTAALAEWNWLVNSKKHHWWVVFNNCCKSWVAYGGLSLYDNETVCFGPDLVLQAMRGRGLQRKLIEVRERWAKRNGYRRLIAVTTYDNIYSANNFIRRGWLLRKAWPGFNPEKDYCLYLEKLLNDS